MLKVIALIIVLSGSVAVWLRVKWANSKNKNTGKKLIEGLRSGRYTVRSMGETLGMTIRTKDIPLMPEGFQYRTKPASLTGQKLGGKFRIFYADSDREGNGVVIGESVFKDALNLSEINTEVDIVYPCWIYIEPDTENNKVYFRSSMPADKDHQYLLEDISDLLYNICIK